MTRTPDLAQIRFDNALALFNEFVQNTVKHPDAATLRGLEGRFALQVQVQPSYWSQIKSRSRQIGERLARQFEERCHKPHGWMDQAHPSAKPLARAAEQAPVLTSPGPSDSPGPLDDDERFIVGLVLTYYRRHPQRARARLLDLLGEVLTPTPGAAELTRSTTRSGKASDEAPAAEEDALDLWRRSQVRVAPLKQKK
jgi:hypothetical protein